MKYKICKLLWQALCCQGVSNTGRSAYVITLFTLVFSSRAQVSSTIEMRLKLCRRFFYDWDNADLKKQKGDWGNIGPGKKIWAQMQKQIKGTKF